MLKGLPRRNFRIDCPVWDSIQDSRQLRNDEQQLLGLASAESSNLGGAIDMRAFLMPGAGAGGESSEYGAIRAMAPSFQSSSPNVDPAKMATIPTNRTPCPVRESVPGPPRPLKLRGGG